jgi:Raf kinase inhibitor-like YbhB/YbcL family protein
VRTKFLTTLLVIATACGDDGGSDSETDALTGTQGDPSSTGSPADSSTGTPGSSEDSSTAAPADSSSSDGADETSSSSGGSESSGDSTTEPVEFTLTSRAYAEGGGIPGIHHVQGGNESPPLDWVGAPAGTMSFGLFFHDVTIDFEHSAIWNIPADATSLPQDVDHVAEPPDVPGALQCRSWTNQFGYGGPGSAANFYQFTLYAIDVETLPEIDQNSSLVEVLAAFEAHSLGTATLTGQSTGPD